MTSQKAVVVIARKEAKVVADWPIPALRDEYILVKNVSVAVNPTDWKAIDSYAIPGALVGCDYAGVVEEVGKKVKKQFKKGDRVCGFAHGCNTLQPQDGGFAEYILAKGQIQMFVPENISFQEAATLGAGITTVGQTLYQTLKLALPMEPTKKPLSILIYGGSTATGTLAIQFAKLSGYTVVTTCSPHNFDLVKGLGADAVFDYKDPNSADEIRKYTKNNLKLVLDTISLVSSVQYCDNAMSTEGGKYSALLSVKIGRDNVDSYFTLGYSAIGEECLFGNFRLQAKPEDLEFGEKFAVIAEKLLAEGKIKPHKPKVGKDGLKGILEGLQLMREGKVSGEKLVYNVAETP